MNSNIVQVFGGYDVRFVPHPEAKYEFGIVATDLAEVLEVQRANDLASVVDEEWKGADTIRTLGGIQSVTVIWEPGIYQVLAKSRKPQAKPFQKWLFEEVLPSIRKTGGYNTKPTPAHQPLPERDTIQFIEAAEKLQSIPGGMLRQLLTDSLIDDLELRRNNQAALPGSKKEYTIVKVRAKELGYSATAIGNGSALGRFVRARIEPALQDRIGIYPVYHYTVSPELDSVIHEFFETR